MHVMQDTWSDKTQELAYTELVAKRQLIFEVIQQARHMRSLLASFESNAQSDTFLLKQRFNKNFLPENDKLDQLVVKLDILLGFSDSDKSLNNAMRKLLLPTAMLIDDSRVTDERQLSVLFKRARDQMHEWSIAASEEMKQYYQDQLALIYAKGKVFGSSTLGGGKP